MMQQKQIRAKKSLGQHFLRDGGTIEKIIRSLNLNRQDVVLEIGCGTGALTRRLVKTTRHYIGIELDTPLFERLEQSFGTSQAVFLNQDVLKVDLNQLQKEYLLASEKFKVVGNIPYYISSPILEHLARHTSVLQLAVIMLQAEVADRLVSLPGTKEYGVLTLMSQYYFQCEELFSVSRRAFRPAPKVYSKVVRLTPKTSRPLLSNQEASFFEFVKKSFSQRRKTLRNCLKVFDPEEEKLETLLERLNYPSDVRAEKISLEHFVTLYLGTHSRARL
jgi:16S rRNA (adenine1518-N6/adenine1519-N6)-dimethyltransferase